MQPLARKLHKHANLNQPAMSQLQYRSICVPVCARVQNRCTSGLISCAVETSVMPWSKDSIEIGVKRLSLSLSDKLEHKLICCMTEKRTEILPRCEKAAGERERQRRQDWVSFVWWGPTCSSKATETQLLCLFLPSSYFLPIVPCFSTPFWP